MNELQQRLERLEKRQAKTTCAIERVQSELKEFKAASIRRKSLTIEVGGLYWARVNLGTDLEHPHGELYDFDAAQAAIPAGWAVPTKEQWKQLYDRTTAKWVERDGTGGFLFVDKESGNELFLPAAGYRHCWTGSLDSQGSGGNYWSSSVCNADNGWYLYFNSGGTISPEHNAVRSYGFSVRCVLNDR